MPLEKNIWEPLEVQGVDLGECIHVYKEEYKDKVTQLDGFRLKLVESDVRTITEYYVIQLRQEHIGFYIPQLVLNKDTFERLYYSPFTRVVDYFVMARNCIDVIPDGCPMPNFEETNDVKFYCFHDSENNIRFNFIIDFTLQ